MKFILVALIAISFSFTAYGHESTQYDMWGNPIPQVHQSNGIDLINNSIKGMQRSIENSQARAERERQRQHELEMQRNEFSYQRQQEEYRRQQYQQEQQSAQAMQSLITDYNYLKEKKEWSRSLIFPHTYGATMSAPASFGTAAYLYKGIEGNVEVAVVVNAPYCTGYSTHYEYKGNYIQLKDMALSSKEQCIANGFSFLSPTESKDRERLLELLKKKNGIIVNGFDLTGRGFTKAYNDLSSW